MIIMDNTTDKCIICYNLLKKFDIDIFNYRYIKCYNCDYQIYLYKDAFNITFGFETGIYYDNGDCFLWICNNTKILIKNLNSINEYIDFYYKKLPTINMLK